MDGWATIGARLRQLRKDRGLTQAEFAAIAGITRSHIAKVEKGSDRLSLDALGLLADEFKTSIAWLIGEAGNSPEGGGDPNRRAVFLAYDSGDPQAREMLTRFAKSLLGASVPAEPPTARPPPNPPVGGSVRENEAREDCRTARVVPLEVRKAG
jgi:transcriptional regulator with XRE-family HTH domain